MLRSAGVRDVIRLHAQVERVTDWREHVRAHPAISALAASVLGYTVVRSVVGKKPQAPQVVVPTSGKVSRQASSTGLLAMAGGFAASMARQWAAEYIKKSFGGKPHDAESIGSTQRTNTTSF